ncbi:transglutaminase domain-containing protein [uncultured Desulfuromonas sp.]|uniref:transglutaminase-like domain-containing protein n=1 Tax=uncultured Desulfuromonas sp. TaxID=181013 RepID=UPI002AAB4443|nr:transglutaminase domain-containing protein [uncultured Desulfuromonas sp.]
MIFKRKFGGYMFSRTLKNIAFVTVLFFSWTSAGGATLAHAVSINSQQVTNTSGQPETSPEEQLATLIAEIETTLADPGDDLKQVRKDLREKLKEVDRLDREIRQGFDKTHQKLFQAGVDETIFQRHERFIATYENNIAELKQNIQELTTPTDRSNFSLAAETAMTHFKKAITPKRYQQLDPENLPHRLLKPLYKEPRMKREEFDQELNQAKTSLINQRHILLASTDPVENPFGPIELSETIEVQFTQDIQAKAAELNHDPVQIYNWVRNNIEFVPTWGSIQGAQMTLETGQGNAFDTASLLIALLRTSGIKARYVMGTVELPIDKIMNWVGDFSDPLAALDFMSSGGVPTKGLVSDGKIVAARIEHVWVEAFVDYIPSRGAKHLQADTWIDLDPSFKQYDYTSAMDIQAAVPFDGQALLDHIQATATINEEQGYATGVDSLYLQQTMQDYQAEVEAYFEQNHPDATVGDVLGKKGVVIEESSFLLGTLPYRTAVVGQAFSDIPDSLRHKVTFVVENEEADDPYADLDDTETQDLTLRLTKSWPELAGKKITLSYSPATASDEAVLESYLPEPHADGTPIEIDELPTKLPAYLINVIPELKIDGEIVASGEPVGLGGTNSFTMSFRDPGYGSSNVSNYINAGEYQAIGLNPGRISKEQLEALKTNLETTKTKLETQDFTNLDKDDLIGDLLYATAISYHAELGAFNFITSKAMGVNALTLPSETIFATKLQVLTLWGIPRFVKPGGLNMDADYLMQAAKAKNGDNDQVKQYMLSSGMTSSALEHEVPEQLFSTEESPAYAISTVKALALANEQNIPIYTIDQDNLSTILPELQIGSQVKTDIQNAVNAGKVVTVSRSNISFYGWTGCGYIITDPETGAGAYMISGGSSGSIFVYMALASFIIPVVFLVALTTAPLALILGVALIGYALRSYLSGINSYLDKVEAGEMSQEMADKLIKTRSILTIFTNFVPIFIGRESEFNALPKILIPFTQILFDLLGPFFSDKI